jgi:hypothetical protein
MDRGVVLIGAHHIGEFRAAGRQHRFDMIENQRRFLFPLGRAGMGRADVHDIGRHAVFKVLSHMTGGENPTPGADTLGVMHAAAGAEFHRQ